MSLVRERPRILATRLEKAALIIEAVWLSGKDGPKIKSESVDASLLRPVTQTVCNHLKHSRMAKIHRVAGAGIVDVITRLVG